VEISENRINAGDSCSRLIEGNEGDKEQEKW